MAELDEVQGFLPLKPADFEILFSLVDGPLHGYAIARAMDERTGGVVRVEAGNLHRTLRKLVRQGLVEPSVDRPPEPEDDERRRYWALTSLGRRVVAADAARMRDAVASAEAKRLIAEGAANA